MLAILTKSHYAMLEEFEKDLHLHIHLENNILISGSYKTRTTLFS